MKYSDYFCLSLIKLGYTNCFALQGGPIMHLINSANKYFKLTELPDTFTGGKNAFLIQGSEYLVAEIEIKESYICSNSSLQFGLASGRIYLGKSFI